MNEHLDLKSADHQVKEFSMNGKNMWGKVVYVYDGDTVHIVFKIDNELVKFNCRLSGIDSPEIVPKNISDVKVKKEEELSAIKCRNYLISRVILIPLEKEIMNKNEVKAICAKSTHLVWVKCHEFDKYGTVRRNYQTFKQSNIKTIHKIVKKKTKKVLPPAPTLKMNLQKLIKMILQKSQKII
jgi:hypothetical protein